MADAGEVDHVPQLERDFKYLSFMDAQKVMEVASPAENDRLWRMYQKKRSGRCVRSSSPVRKSMRVFLTGYSDPNLSAERKTQARVLRKEWGAPTVS